MVCEGMHPRPHAPSLQAFCRMWQPDESSPAIPSRRSLPTSATNRNSRKQGHLRQHYAPNTVFDQMSRPPTSGRWPLFVQRRINSRAAGMPCRVPSGLLPNAASELPCQLLRQPASHSPQDLTPQTAFSPGLRKQVELPERNPLRNKPLFSE